MLKKKERLTRDLFNRSFSVGKRVNLPYLQIVIDTSTPFHGSVVVSKKVYKKAVDRNKLRRRLYSVLSSVSKSTDTPATFIIITKPAIKTVPAPVFTAELTETLKKFFKK